jgi:hypothetical protein
MPGRFHSSATLRTAGFEDDDGDGTQNRTNFLISPRHSSGNPRHLPTSVRCFLKPADVYESDRHAYGVDPGLQFIAYLTAHCGGPFIACVPIRLLRFGSPELTDRCARHFGGAAPVALNVTNGWRIDFAGCMVKLMTHDGVVAAQSARSFAGESLLNSPTSRLARTIRFRKITPPDRFAVSSQQPAAVRRDWDQHRLATTNLLPACRH